MSRFTSRPAAFAAGRLRGELGCGRIATPAATERLVDRDQRLHLLLLGLDQLHLGLERVPPRHQDFVVIEVGGTIQHVRHVDRGLERLDLLRQLFVALPQVRHRVELIHHIGVGLQDRPLVVEHRLHLSGIRRTVVGLDGRAIEQRRQQAAGEVVGQRLRCVDQVRDVEGFVADAGLEAQRG
ncbi:MAG: hypothetical protein U0168_09115 [Nannocystaceae bacterium]